MRTILASWIREANPDRLSEYSRRWSRENKGLRNRENREKTRERQKLRIANKKLRIANKLDRIHQSTRNLESKREAQRRRTEARQQGLKHYWTDTPCKNGHLAERFVCDNKCCECKKQRNHRYQARRYAADSDAVKQRLREYQLANPERYRKATKKWRDKNPGRVREYGRRAKAKRRSKRHESQVYFVRIGQHIKIGTTTNMNARLQQLRGSSAEEITVLLTIPGDRKLERALHDLLQEDRIRLEFFRDSWFIGEFIRRAAWDACNIDVGVSHPHETQDIATVSHVSQRSENDNDADAPPAHWQGCTQA
jgi:hypothetical protein